MNILTSKAWTPVSGILYKNKDSGSLNDMWLSGPFCNKTSENF